MADPKFPAGPVALVALVLCCALPALLVVGGGVAASALGLGLRFWPVTLVGGAVVSVGVIGVARRLSGQAWRAAEPRATIVIDDVAGASGRSGPRGVLPRLALLLVAIALAASSCASRGSSGSNAQTSKVTELRSVSELQDRFEKDRGKIRLILLMSPT